ncbi:MAG TPA: DUF4340 domain-containing protein [Burkholderiales bacterium]|nr:DUF4340 domain-containing protein [Burkholderiales bacterium]
MNARVALVLVVLLAVVGGGALLYNRQERTETADNTAALGKPLLNVKVADVAAIKITEPNATLTLKRQGDGWVIAERRNFPADLARVREFGLKLIDLKVGQSEPIGDKDRARLNLDASGTQVELDGADGKPLAKLTIGKKYFKREVDNPAKALADGRFVALPAESGTVYIVSAPLTQATTKTSEWIDRTAFQVEKVKTLEVKYPSGASWRVERKKDDADWKLAGAKPGEKLDVSKANAATYSLSLLELADVAPDDAKDTGLDKPTLIDATTLDGLAYDIKVGKLEGDNYYVRFSSSGSLPTDAQKGDEDRLKKLRERQPREKLLSDYVLLIPKSKLDDTLKPRADLLEKKPEAKKK